MWFLIGIGIIVSLVILIVSIHYYLFDKEFSHLEIVKINDKYYTRVWFIRTRNNKLFCKYTRSSYYSKYDEKHFVDFTESPNSESDIDRAKYVYERFLSHFNEEKAKKSIGNIPDEEIILTSQKPKSVGDIEQLVQLELDGRIEEALELKQKLLNKKV